jgi:citrate synthase
MNKLARCVLALYSYDDNPDDTSVENVIRQSISLIGSFPALIAYAYQAKSTTYENKSLHLHYPIPELSTSENILRMIRPTGEYTDLEAKLLDISMMLHAEHGGGNNSSFTTHLISSSGTDTYAAISAAVSSLKGPKHGGANIAVIRMIEDLKKNVKDITNLEKVEDYLVKVLKKQANDRSGLVYGMGHAIYTLSDPRAKMLKGMAKQLAESKDLMDEFLLCDFIEKKTPQLYAEITGIEKPMPANVDLYSGLAYSMLGIPEELFTPLFATARVAGWVAHNLENKLYDGRIMRPATKYVGETQDFIPMRERR